MNLANPAPGLLIEEKGELSMVEVLQQVTSVAGRLGRLGKFPKNPAVIIISIGKNLWHFMVWSKKSNIMIEQIGKRCRHAAT